MREPSIEAKVQRCEYPDDRYWEWSFKFDGYPQHGTRKGKRRAKRAARKHYRTLLDAERRLDQEHPVETFRIGP